MCPNKSNEAWGWQKQYAKEDFKKAVAFEKQIQKEDEAMWLTRDAKPLEQADFSRPDDLFTHQCKSGYCFM